MTSDRAFGRQDLRTLLERASAERPDDVVVVDETVDPDQGVTAIVEALRRRGLAPIVVCRSVNGLDLPVVTNVFASRERIAWMLGGGPHDLHEAYRRGSAGATPPRDVGTGPILDHVTTSGLDLRTLPMLRHFDEDAAPYLTSAIVVAEDPDAGIGNLSYHRCMVASDTGLATSLHSRGHLWRYLRRAGELGRPLPVAVVIGGHPLFMLAASARAGVDVDERDLAGGLFGEPLEVIRTPQHGIGVPAAAEIVLEGTIDADIRVEEGPFGEYSGYASHRSTNNLIDVSAVLRRENPMFLDVVSGNAADHLNLGRVPREAELAGTLKARFPDLAAIEYPASGTHFHCFASLGAGATGQARQLLLALLGMDPYMKLAVVVDDDVDVRREDEVWWAVATRFQADRDLIVVPRLPGSLLDPSSDEGVTARMGLDATRGEIDAPRVTIRDEAFRRAEDLLGEGGPAATGRRPLPAVER